MIADKRNILGQPILESRLGDGGKVADPGIKAQHRFLLLAQQIQENRLLAAEMQVERRPAATRGADDIIDGCCLDAPIEEASVGRLADRKSVVQGTRGSVRVAY